MTLGDIIAGRTPFGRQLLEGIESLRIFSLGKQQPKGEKIMSDKDRIEVGQMWTIINRGDFSCKLIGIYRGRVWMKDRDGLHGTFKITDLDHMTHEADGSPACGLCGHPSICGAQNETGEICTRASGHDDGHAACAGKGRHGYSHWPQVEPKKNWQQRIDEARERGEFTKEDKTLATGWPDCACGEQDHRIPRLIKEDRGYTGEPLDEKLKRVGMFFTDAVNVNNFRLAKYFLEEVEARSAEIIAEIESFTQRN